MTIINIITLHVYNAKHQRGAKLLKLILNKKNKLSFNNIFSKEICVIEL